MELNSTIIYLNRLRNEALKKRTSTTDPDKLAYYDGQTVAYTKAINVLEGRI